MTLSRRLLLVMALTTVSGCAGGDGALSGECNARIRIDGVIYEADNAAIATPQGPTSRVGAAEVLGCTEDGWEAIDQTEALKIDGVPVTTAIAVEGGDYPGVYVAVGTGPSDWPDVIRRDERG